MMFGAGALSGLLGIGSGAVKVIAMDRAMRIPFKVSTTTSNFMIGVTAAASAGLYLSRGFIDPRVAMPVMLGVLGGALAGSQSAGARARPHAQDGFCRCDSGPRHRNDRQRLHGKDIAHMDDHRLEVIIGRFCCKPACCWPLRSSPRGGVLYLVRHHADRANYRTFVAGGPAIRRFPASCGPPRTSRARELCNWDCCC